jgi:hypothetical protein
MLVTAAGFSALLAAGAFWGARKGQIAVLLLLQLVCLFRLYPLIETDSTSYYRDPAPWAQRVGSGSAVLMGVTDPAVGGPAPDYRFPEPSNRELVRIRHLDLDFPTGVAHGLRYPIHHEGAGLGSPLLAIVRRNLGNLDWRQRANWFRVLGLQYVTATLPTPPPGLQIVDRAARFGVPTTLMGLPGVAPAAWWPVDVAQPSDADAAYRHVSTTADPIASVVAPSRQAHVPGASVNTLELQPDRIRISVSGGGGVLAVRRAYHPLLRATVGGQAVRTLPVQLALLGVEIPAGDHVVEITVSNRPDRLALLGPLAALLALAFLRRPTGRRPRLRWRPRQEEL